MKKFAVYIVGLLVVLAAVWVLLTQTSVSSFVPLTVIVVVLLAILGLGVMSSAKRVDETVPQEVVETKQQVGDTQIRRSKLQ